MGEIIQNHLSQMLFDSVTCFRNPPVSALMGYFKQHHNLLSEGCLITSAGCPPGYPAYFVSGDDRLESNQIALTGYLEVMLT